MSILKRKLDRPLKLGFLGLDNAGKTKIVERWANEIDPHKHLPPTTSLNLKKIETDSFTALVLDAPGQETYRDSDWPKTIKESDFILYVIDGCDKKRIDNSLTEFNNRVKDYLGTRPLFILINKQDLIDQSPFTVDEIKYKFDYPANYYATSAVNGSGLQQVEQKLWRIAIKKK